VPVDPIKHCLKSGSGRVLNCLRVAQSLPADDPTLLFRTRLLNNTILIKEPLIQRDAEGPYEGAKVGTKLYLPFDPDAVLDGGRTVFFGQRGFDAAMAELLDLTVPARRQAMEMDRKVLRVLDELPTFAPFLLKDKLERAGIAASDQYYEISLEEWSEIRRYIRDRFRLILDKVVGGVGTQDALERLIDALWDLNDQPALENLAKAFGLPSMDASEIFYSWKGVLYFAWEYERAKPRVHEMLRWFLDTQKMLGRFPAASRPMLERALQDVQSRLVQILKIVEDNLGEYQLGFNELFLEGRGSSRFTTFLRRSRTYFHTVGSSVGQLQHAAEIWDALTRSFPRRHATLEAVLDLEATLADLLGPGNKMVA
jgi:hypothetical protein